MLSTLPAVRRRDSTFTSPRRRRAAGRGGARRGCAARRVDDARCGGARRPLEQIRDDLAQACRAVVGPIWCMPTVCRRRGSRGRWLAAAGVPSIGHLRDIVKLSRQAIDDVNCHRSAGGRVARDARVPRGAGDRRGEVRRRAQRRRSRRVSAAAGDRLFAPRAGSAAASPVGRHDRPARDAEGDGRGARGGDAVGGGDCRTCIG